MTSRNTPAQNSQGPPKFDLPLPDRPEIITANALKLNTGAKDERMKEIMDSLIKHTHAFVTETGITTAEWMAAIEFLTATGQKCSNIRQEFILLSDVLGISALVDAYNNPRIGNATESSVLGPFFTDDAHDIPFNGSIASEGKGKYMYVSGRVVNTSGSPIPNCTIETWEADETGTYDTQYEDREAPDCRGRLKTDKDGKFGYRAIVPNAYPIPGDGPVGHLLEKLGRHNMRPNHLHMMFVADGYESLTTALYPEGDKYLASDAVFGVKKSLVVKMGTVDDDAKARELGFPKGGSFRWLEHEFVLVTPDEAKASRAQLPRNTVPAA